MALSEFSKVFLIFMFESGKNIFIFFVFLWYFFAYPYWWNDSKRASNKNLALRWWSGEGELENWRRMKAGIFHLFFTLTNFVVVWKRFTSIILTPFFNAPKESRLWKIGACIDSSFSQMFFLRNHVPTAIFFHFLYFCLLKFGFACFYNGFMWSDPMFRCSNMPSNLVLLLFL